MAERDSAALSCRVSAGSVAAEDAVVLDALDAGRLGAGDRLVMDDAVLQPEIGNPQANHLVHDARHMLGGTEDVDQVDLRNGLSSFKIGVTGLAVDLLEHRVDRQHPVTVLGQVAADVVAGAIGLVAHAEDSDGAGGAKHFVDEMRIVHGSPALRFVGMPRVL